MRLLSSASFNLCRSWLFAPCSCRSVMPLLLLILRRRKSLTCGRWGTRTGATLRWDHGKRPSFLLIFNMSNTSFFKHTYTYTLLSDWYQWQRWRYQQWHQQEKVGEPLGPVSEHIPVCLNCDRMPALVQPPPVTLCLKPFINTLTRYQPDTIVYHTINGTGYLFTANEVSPACKAIDMF